MKTQIQQMNLRKPGKAVVSGFTLVETLVAIAIGAAMLAAFYATLASGFTLMSTSREDLRATQILLKRLESIRLCTFGQVVNTTYNPATFVEYFDPAGQATGNGGAVYQGKYTATAPPPGSLPESYRTNMLLVTVEVAWNTGQISHNRSMQTYVAREGIHGYVSVGR